MKFSKRNSANHYSLPRALFHTILVTSSYLLMGLPPALVLMYAHDLSTPMFLLLMTLSFVWLVVLGEICVRPFILRSERTLLGDEAFFQKHPREFRREVARWHKVSAFINGVNDSDIELLPGLLQLKRELSSDDAARLGIVYADSKFEEEFKDVEFSCEKYDRIYYSKHPRMLKRELRRLNLKRSLFLLLQNRDMPVDPYERRLIELREEYAAAGCRVLAKAEKPKKNSSTDYSFVRAASKYLFMFLLIPIIGFPYGYVTIHAHALSTPVYLVLKALAFALIPATVIIITKPMLLRAERYMFGDERFFSRHPREYRRELARWHKVSAQINGAKNDPEPLPGLLQIKRELTDEDASRFGVNLATGTADGSLANESGLELDLEKYDRIYYGKRPRRIEKELRSIKVKRAFSLIFKNEDTQHSSYESRLYELKDEFLGEEAA
ncbi:MAG: hypothetical protein IKI64_08440 [Clostridia bacterium]|nr:hypothetical protein [Clostridia bacterium]